MMRGLNPDVFYGDCIEKCKNSCSKNCSEKKDIFEKIIRDAIIRSTPKQKIKSKEYATYIKPPHYPYPGVTVQVIKRHPEGEGGGITIKFPDVLGGGERHTLNNYLTF